MIQFSINGIFVGVIWDISIDKKQGDKRMKETHEESKTQTTIDPSIIRFKRRKESKRERILDCHPELASQD